MERAEALVREMEEEGIDAPIAIYHTMMDGYTMVADEKKGLIVFKRLKVICFIFGIFLTSSLVSDQVKMGFLFCYRNVDLLQQLSLMGVSLISILR